VPYFPNWEASGATGPYYTTPNLMVVVPTSHHVVLSYGTTTVDWIGKVASVVGFGGLFLIAPGTVGTGLQPGTGAAGWADNAWLALTGRGDEGSPRIRRRRRRSGPGTLDEGDDVSHGDDPDDPSLGHHHYD
jgi:hypothetical protein